MITLRRLGHSDEPFQLNPDMIVTVESTPDTVITLATGAKVVVAETPEEVAAAVHAYRADVLGEALRRRRPERRRPARRRTATRRTCRRSRTAEPAPPRRGARPATVLSARLRAAQRLARTEEMPAAADVGCNEGCNGHRNRSGLRVAAAELDDGRDEPGLVHQHPGADDHPRRHRRGHARERRHGLDEARAEPLQARDLRRTAGHARRSSTGSSRSPTRPAARACWRSTRSSARSRTPSPATPCSSSSTAPTRRWCTRSSRPRSTAWPRATRPAPRRSRRPAASRRRWASSAPSSGSCTCSRTSPRPRRSGRRSRPRSSRR